KKFLPQPLKIPASNKKKKKNSQNPIPLYNGPVTRSRTGKLTSSSIKLYKDDIDELLKQTTVKLKNEQPPIPKSAIKTFSYNMSTGDTNRLNDIHGGTGYGIYKVIITDYFLLQLHIYFHIEAGHDIAIDILITYLLLKQHVHFHIQLIIFKTMYRTTPVNNAHCGTHLNIITFIIIHYLQILKYMFNIIYSIKTESTNRTNQRNDAHRGTLHEILTDRIILTPTNTTIQVHYATHGKGGDPVTSSYNSFFIIQKSILNFIYCIITTSTNRTNLVHSPDGGTGHHIRTFILIGYPLLKNPLSFSHVRIY
ncbi:unnamed protein product, partial [Rotaria sordida]